jgi:hypothetical protein
MVETGAEMCYFSYGGMLMKKVIIIFSLWAAVLWPLAGQGGGNDAAGEAPFLVTVSPALILPVGAGADLLSPGGASWLTLEYGFPSRQGLYAGAEAAYAYLPLDVDAGLSVIWGGLTAGLELPLAAKLRARMFADGGYYHALVRYPDEERGEGSVYAGGGAGLRYAVSPALSVGLEGAVRYAVSLSNTVSLSLSGSYRPGAGRRQPKVYFQIIDFPDVYPVLFKHYDDHPAGRAVVGSDERFPLTDVTVSVFIKQFMDTPKTIEPIASLEAGARKEVDLYALLNDSVLSVTEATKVAADISIDYRYRGKEYSQDTAVTLRVLDRNAMRWDDDRKAAAFVTARDPAVLTLAKNVAGLVRRQGYPLIDENLRIAMGIHEALALYGINYVVDPKTPYKELSAQKLSVDYLQFPRQTLEYKGGDCDDLSILYCALLEAVGIETAFITVPGHIFMAFAMKGEAEEILKGFSKPDDLIARDGRAWVPFEITERYDGFLAAWQAGARLWREQEGKGQARVYPLHEAWSLYEPVGLPGDAASTPAQVEGLEGAFENELVKFINREIYPQVARLNEEIDRQGPSARLLNSLGVLYARYGLNEKALGVLNDAIARYQEYVPALMNIGNIHFLAKNYDRALAYYERAASAQPGNSRALLAIARVNHEIENYGSAKRAYETVERLDPALARRFSYLGLTQAESARAADTAAARSTILWE